MFTRKFTTILISIGLLATAGAAFGVTDMRFWAWKDDLSQVADISFAARISQKSGDWLNTLDRLDKCQKERRDCSFLAKRADELKREIGQLEDDRKRLGN